MERRSYWLCEAQRVIFFWRSDACPFSLFFRSGAWTVVLFILCMRSIWVPQPSQVARVGFIPTRLPLTSLCDPQLLFVYFQVNNGVLAVIRYTPRTVSYAKELTSVYICYSQRNGFKTPLSMFYILYTLFSLLVDLVVILLCSLFRGTVLSYLGRR